MRYAILSDIHGNLWALEAVLNDAKQRGIDQFINLGDVLYGPLKPMETYSRLQTIDAVTIQGNEDREVYEFQPSGENDHPTLTAMLNQLNDEAVQWLRALPKTAAIAEQIFACHGTPSSDVVYLLEDVSTGHPLVKDDRTILTTLAGLESYAVILCGHSHIARVVQLSSGQLVVNPGSVGVPAYDDDAPTYHAMQTYSPLAAYAVLEQRQGTWQVELIKVPYAVDLAVEHAQRQGRNDWGEWLKTGRVSPNAA